MSTFTRDDVEHVARLARLELTEDEKTLFAAQLAGILAYAEQIQAVDTSGVEPTSHVVASAASMRDDVVVPCLDRPDALAGSPDASAAAGLFKVPRVL